MTIYLDLIFLENIFMNLIIIYATSIILKKEVKIVRIFLGSITGAIYACVYYITNIEIYSSAILKILLSLVIVYISFNSKTLKKILKDLLIFYLTSFTFGGVTFALLYFISPNSVLFKKGVLVGIYPLRLILIGGLIGFIIIISAFKTIKNKIERKDMTCTIKLGFKEKNMVIKAIVDTGNFLKEPLTGMPVIIVEKDIIKELIPGNILSEIENIMKGTSQIEDNYKVKIKLIPFTALGTQSGLLVGIKPDEFIINYQEKKMQDNNVIIGIYNKKLSTTNKYNALVGLDLIEKI